MMVAHCTIEEFLEPSDEEVLAESDDPSSFEDDFEDAEEAPAPTGKEFQSSKSRHAIQDSDTEGSVDPGLDEDAKGWGTSKKDYYGADAIETEANALEEGEEARRLQQKQLQNMTEADFGFDEVDWLEAGKDGEDDGEDGDGVRREVLPKLEITDYMGPEERMKIMRTRYPEFEPLAKEFLDLRGVHEKLSKAAMDTLSGVAEFEPIESPTPVALLKHRALTAYLASLSMYFALLTSGAKSTAGKATAMPPEELREHSVMETLVQCRDLWERVKEIPTPKPPSDLVNGNGAIELDYEPLKDGIPPAKPIENGHTSKHRNKRARKVERLALASQAEADARRQERLRQTEESLASLSTLTAPSSNPPPSKRKRRTIHPQDEDSNSDFGDATSLTPHELAEKARRKKSLKFYTSQIAQKSNKRANAGGDAGGDADIPHRERLRDRQERLNAEAEKRGKKPKESGKGAPLGNGSGDEGEERTNAQRAQNGDAGDGSGSEDYYDLIAARSASKKASKAARAQAHAADDLVASGAVVNPNDIALDPDGKRAITYAIEKNKGLHPHRKKDVRNPRVKKRKKFEEKKKKLGSVRAVYNSQREGKGGYGGEKTGIKRGLVRSVRL